MQSKATLEANKDLGNDKTQQSKQAHDAGLKDYQVERAKQYQQQKLVEVKKLCEKLETIFSPFTIANTRSAYGEISKHQVHVTPEAWSETWKSKEFQSMLNSLQSCQGIGDLIHSLIQDVKNRNMLFLNQEIGEARASCYVELSKSVDALNRFIAHVKKQSELFDESLLATVIKIHQFKMALSEELNPIENNLTYLREERLTYSAEQTDISERILAIQDQPEDFDYNYEAAVLSVEQEVQLSELNLLAETLANNIIENLSKTHLIENLYNNIQPVHEILGKIFGSLSDIFSQKAIDDKFLDEIIAVIHFLKNPSIEIKTDYNEIINCILTFTLNLTLKHNFQSFLKKIDTKFQKEGIEAVLDILINIKDPDANTQHLTLLALFSHKKYFANCLEPICSKILGVDSTALQGEPEILDQLSRLITKSISSESYKNSILTILSQPGKENFEKAKDLISFAKDIEAEIVKATKNTIKPIPAATENKKDTKISPQKLEVIEVKDPGKIILADFLTRLNLNPDNSENLLKENSYLPFLSSLYNAIHSINQAEYPNIHKNKFILLGKCRTAGLNQLKELIKELPTKHAKIDLLTKQRNMPLFASHRNHGFFQTIGRTSTLIEIDKMIKGFKEGFLERIANAIGRSPRPKG